MPIDALAKLSRSRLAIAIPAFGRAEAIAASIASMTEEAGASNLPITFYVSDDTPDASVEDALAALAAAGLPIVYRRNTPSLGHDRNLVSTLLWPDADYVWLLGSGFRAAPNRLEPVLRFLDDQDLVFLNIHAPDQPEVAAIRGEAARELLRDRLWHQALTGATIYGPRVRHWMREKGETLLIMRNFPQISAMMGFASAHELVIGWLAGGRNLEASGAEGGSYWHARAIDVFAYDWSAAVAAFPAIVPPGEVARVTREHSARTDLFNTTTLIALKVAGQFRVSSLRHPGVRRAMHLPLWKLVAVLMLPVPVLRGSGNVLMLLKRATLGITQRLARRTAGDRLLG